MSQRDYGHPSPTHCGQHATYSHGPGNHYVFYALGLDFFPEMWTGGLALAAGQNAAGPGRMWPDSCLQMGLRDRQFTSALKRVGSGSLKVVSAVLHVKRSSCIEGISLQKPIEISQGPFPPILATSLLPLHYSSFSSTPTISRHSPYSPGCHSQMRKQDRGRDPCPSGACQPGQR